MTRKKSKKRVPAPGTVEHAAMRTKISTGMSAAKKRRRDRGLWSQMETAVYYALPLRFVRNAVKTGQLRAIQVGSRAYIRAEDAEAVFGKRVA